MTVEDTFKEIKVARKIKEIRREELLRAALDTLMDVGIANATVVQVSQAAGMAPGMIHHYFKSKTDLIEGALRFANAQLRDDVIRQTRVLTSPKERLFKIIEVNFSDRWFQAGATRMWITFCAEVPFNPNFSRIQKAIHSRMRSNLTYNLRLILEDKKDIEKVAFGLSNLIDGLWLQAAVQEDDINAARAINITEDYLSRFGITR